MSAASVPKVSGAHSDTVHMAQHDLLPGTCAFTAQCLHMAQHDLLPGTCAIRVRCRLLA